MNMDYRYEGCPTRADKLIRRAVSPMRETRQPSSHAREITCKFLTNKVTGVIEKLAEKTRRAHSHPAAEWKETPTDIRY